MLQDEYAFGTRILSGKETSFYYYTATFKHDFCDVLFVKRELL